MIPDCTAIRFPRAGAAALILLASASASAQDSASAGAQAILAKIDAARAGPSGSATTLALEGTFTVAIDGVANGEPVLEGTFREIFAGEKRARHVGDLGDIGGVMERGTTDDMVWEIDPASGPKVHEPGSAAALRRYFGLLRGVPSSSLYRTTRNAGTKEIDGQANVVVTMVPESGPEDTWFVDAATGRLTQVRMVLPTTDGADLVWGLGRELESTLSLADWRVVNGVDIPHRRILKMGPTRFAYEVKKAVVGEPIPAERFAPPEAVARAKGRAVVIPPSADDAPAYQVVEREAQAFAGIRVACKTAELGATLAVLYPEIMSHLNAIGVRITGVPILRYLEVGPDELEIEAGLPVAQPVAEKGRIRNGELPAGRTLVGWHFGPYEGLAAAHRALAAHAAERKLKPRGPSWEVYWTDPGVVPEPARWRTQLFLPVED
jgi:effector-binding domain-containing protein